MHGSSHRGLNPKASIDEARWTHPDLTPDGELRPDHDVPVDKRDFNRRWADPAFREHLMERITAAQKRQPVEIQRWVSGRAYGTDADPHGGWLEYADDVRAATESWGYDKRISGEQVHDMSDQEYDSFFDRGQLRPERVQEGYTYVAGPRDVIVDDQHVDRYSAAELEMRARDQA